MMPYVAEEGVVLFVVLRGVRIRSPVFSGFDTTVSAFLRLESEDMSKEGLGELHHSIWSTEIRIKTRDDKPDKTNLHYTK